MRTPNAAGGWRAIWYTITRSRKSGGFLKMYRAMRSKNACKTCALGMGGQRGGMVNEKGHFPEVCKKSIQAMSADLQGAIHQNFFNDFSFEKLRGFTSSQLESAGRLAKPLYAGPLDNNYREISWDEALDKITTKMKRIEPDDAFFYFSGRSSNESGFLLQLLARVWGTNNVNNCSYYCHQASGVALATVTGSGTATLTLDDLDRCDQIWLIGCNPSSNHPRLMSDLMRLKRRGGKVIVINPLKELGLCKFRVPSDPRSLIFGTTIADLYIQPTIGGDIALLSAITKEIIERGAVDHAFVEKHADDWQALRDHLQKLSWDDVLHSAGVSRQIINQAADQYVRSNNTIFCWAMGVTHHAHGVENVQAISNLAMARGMLGRPGAGLLPLRGHSNVQGIGSMGVTPVLKQAIFDELERAFDIKLPTRPGMDTLECMEHAASGHVKLAFCLGGNLFGSNPDATFAHKSLSAIDTVVYLNTTLNTGHVHGRGRETIILPVLARDEEPQPTTQESMFNYVRLSDGGPPRLEGPRAEIDVIAAIAEKLFESGGPIDWSSMREYQSIRHAISKIIPGYEKIGDIDATKKEFQIEGRTFHDPVFPTDTGRAKFHVIPIPDSGKQLGRGELRLMTVRSEGQFNTVVYEEEDIYRGQDRRDVIMLNPRDITKFGLNIDQRVTVRSACGALSNVLVRSIDVAPGCAVMYYPEANVLVPKVADQKSKTPAFKHTRVTIEPAPLQSSPTTNGHRSATPPAAVGTTRDKMRSC